MGTLPSLASTFHSISWCQHPCNSFSTSVYMYHQLKANRSLFCVKNNILVGRGWHIGSGNMACLLRKFHPVLWSPNVIVSNLRWPSVWTHPSLLPTSNSANYPTAMNTHICMCTQSASSKERSHNPHSHMHATCTKWSPYTTCSHTITATSLLSEPSLPQTFSKNCWWT